MAVIVGTLKSDGSTPWIYGKWVQPPAQDRSERTFFRILDAAEGLLSQRLWHEVSVQDIVKGAEASVGSFYNRFNDKAALLHCLDDRLGKECELTIESLIEEVGAVPALVSSLPAITVSLLMRLCTERKGVIRALDLARKMSTNEIFAGMAPRFDGALATLADFLRGNDPAMAEYSQNSIVTAFRETFWIARENLLYERGRFDDGEMHQTLMRHFAASLKA